MFVLGTIYLKYPGTTKVIIRGQGTETTVLKDNLGTVSIEEGALVSVTSSVTIGDLQALDSENGDVCKVTVKTGQTLTATAMGKYNQTNESVSTPYKYSFFFKAFTDYSLNVKKHKCRLSSAKLLCILLSLINDIA